MAKKEKNKTVYIAMGVDLVHPGHLSVIEEGRKYGDIVIGLMTDEALATYKRVPYMTYEQRRVVVENLKGVTKVIPQTTLDYRPNLKKVKPDYVIHGDDWKTGIQKETRRQVIEAVRKWGGQVIDVPRIDDLSSTNLNNALKEFGTTPQIRLKMLKRILEAKPLAKGIEVHNGLTGLIAEHVSTKRKNQEKQESFDFMWLSSLTDSTAKGKPDIELVDSTSRAQTIQDVMEVTTKPIIYDGDSGGHVERFPYLVRTLERLGVSAVIIEDKKGLKENSLAEKSTQPQASIKEFSEKIKAGRKARVTEDFMIIARIESLIMGKGQDDAMKRAKAYIAAGADGIMIHSKAKSPTEILTFCKAYKKLKNKVPLVVVPSTYPSVTETQLEKAGVNIVIYANHLLRCAYPAMVKTAESILKEGHAAEADKKFCMPIRDVLKLIK